MKNELYHVRGLLVVSLHTFLLCSRQASLPSPEETDTESSKKQIRMMDREHWDLEKVRAG